MITKCPFCFSDLIQKHYFLTCRQEDHQFSFTTITHWIQIITRKIDLSWYCSDKTIECYVATTSYYGESFKGAGAFYELPWFEPNLSNIQLSIDKIQKLLVFT